jgi:hypothetical protein
MGVGEYGATRNTGTCTQMYLSLETGKLSLHFQTQRKKCTCLIVRVKLHYTRV